MVAIFVLPTTGWCYVQVKLLDRPKSLAIMILCYDFWTYIAYILLIYFSLGAVYYARRRKKTKVWMIICMYVCMYLCMYVYTKLHHFPSISLDKQGSKMGHILLKL